MKTVHIIKHTDRITLGVKFATNVTLSNFLFGDRYWQ